MIAMMDFFRKEESRGVKTAVRQMRKAANQTFIRFELTVLFLVLIPACAPYPRYRPYSHPRRMTSPSVTPEDRIAPGTRDLKTKDQTLQEPYSWPKATSKDVAASEKEATPAPPDDSSLIAKIDPTTPPYRAVSLRLTEAGKKLLESGEYIKALGQFEKTVALDSTNPYAYYYLAKTHYQMGQYEDSLNFLDVAESLLPEEPYWLAEVYVLRGENLYALGSFQRAGSSYSEALRWNPENQIASEGIDRIQGKAPPSPR